MLPLAGVFFRSASNTTAATVSAVSRNHLPAGFVPGTPLQQSATRVRRHYQDGATSEYAECVQSAAELVGRPTAHFSLSRALEGDWRQVAHQVRQLVTERPLVMRALRDCSDSGLPSGSIRGLLVLLVSKALGTPCPRGATKATVQGTENIDILPNQRKLAEVAELCHVIFMMHETVTNSLQRLQSRDPNDLDPETSHESLNKIAILCGDFLVASVLKDVSMLRNSKVYALVVEATRQISESSFHDLDPTTVDPNNILRTWKEKNTLAISSVISNHCQGALLLAGNENEADHTLVHSFGKHMGLVWQAKHELDELIDYSATSDGGRHLNYSSLPLLLHFQLTSSWNKLCTLNAAEERALAQEVLTKGHGVHGCLDVIEEHSLEAQRLLWELPPCDARTSLTRIVQSISSRTKAPAQSITLHQSQH